MKNQQGCDVSHWQGRINFALMKAFALFCIAKASQGVGMVDQTFGYNWMQTKANGIIRGAYHFFLPGINGQKQATHFIETVIGWKPGDIIPMIDVESSKGVTGKQLAIEIERFRREIADSLKLHVLMYTGPGFWKGTMQNSTAFSDMPLMTAQYTNAAAPLLYGGWKTWHIWQKSGTGRMKGVIGNCDIDFVNPNVTFSDLLVKV